MKDIFETRIKTNTYFKDVFQRCLLNTYFKDIVKTRLKTYVSTRRLLKTPLKDVRLSKTSVEDAFERRLLEASLKDAF